MRTINAPGHLTYGISPMEGVCAEVLGFRRPLRAIRAKVIDVSAREPGDDVAPGMVSTAGRAAVLLFGIDNGHQFSAAASVLVRDVRCPVLSVTAEYTVVDTTDLPEVVVGDVATIVGGDGDDEITLQQVAARSGRSAGYWMMFLRRISLRYGCAGIAPPSLG